jgi:hypothetical protein
VQSADDPNAVRGALALAAKELFRREIALSVAEHNVYLEEYGSLADSVRAMELTPPPNRKL